MKHQRVEADPLFAGFYSTSDAARLLGLSGTVKLRGWLNGWPGSASGPIVERDFKSTSTVSFLDLMEMRFIEFFRGQGVTMQTLRKAAERARNDWGSDHPFALSKAKYLTDRRKIFAQVAEETGDKVTWDMASGQHEIWLTIENIIAKGVEFDPETELASRWFPRPSEFPTIAIDPKLAFGRPVVTGPGVPTAALFRQWKAEAGNSKKVAAWFNVSAADVDNAVEFELQTAA
ncbi:DUF433 domain-containing protein [Sphingosinicella rhizophila]|uniref:DUF433 domain-containing protein n=1 Tax=Sphingosinicella rhizophila TaxID=3050082 RepID=A0ABU3Q558_9SPHN|nr:hypothetical protein [Sphingosinicella sp. GR2756]MDT9598545.1 hypothetical protein [Sphingosinicella sp. GR2756]